MSCNCIEETNELLVEKYGEGSGACLKTGYALDNKTNGLRLALSFDFSFRRKTKAGFAKNITTGTVSPTFCPFCGKRYLED